MRAWGAVRIAEAAGFAQLKPQRRFSFFNPEMYLKGPVLNAMSYACMNAAPASRETQDDIGSLVRHLAEEGADAGNRLSMA